MKEIEIPLASTDKYEEALSKARFEYEKNPCASEGEKRLLEIIFPELRESELERAARDYALKVDMGTCGEIVIPAFIAGAEWQEKQDQETIELAEDHAMLAGKMQMKEEMEKIMENDPDDMRYECVGWRGLFRNSYSIDRAAAPSIRAAKIWYTKNKVKPFSTLNIRGNSN